MFARAHNNKREKLYKIVLHNQSEYPSIKLLTVSKVVVVVVVVKKKLLNT